MFHVEISPSKQLCNQFNLEQGLLELNKQRMRLSSLNLSFLRYSLALGLEAMLSRGAGS
jgi:hypothetical protein